MEKRKIIFTVINDLTYDQRMIRFCTELAAAGYDVELTGRKLPGSKPLKQRNYTQTRLQCFFHKGKLFYIEYNIRLFFHLLGKRFHIISAVDLDTIAPCYLAGKIKNRPIVFDAHEYFTEVPEVVNRPNTKKVWEMVANFFIPKIRYCYTVGPMLAQLFTQKYRTGFETITNAPEKKPMPQVEKVPGTILYQGALNKGRGIENYIDMMQHLDGCTLWIVGEGDLSKELRQRAKDRQVEDRIKFFGYVEPEKLSEITCAAYIGLNVSENAGLSYYYSLNNKVFDHIHALLPTVTNKFPEYMEMDNKYHIMVFADATPQSVAEQVKLLMENKSLYETLRENCKIAREELCWEREKPKLLNFYNNVR